MQTTRTRRPRHVRLAAVPYDDYVRLRDAWGNRHLRMAYSDGVLEIISPEFLHDRGARHLLLLVVTYCKTFDVACETCGSTTIRNGEPGRLKGQGKEPDEGFYLREAAEAVAGRDTLDMAVDPPPSLWIEVDNWGSSKAKLPVYAALGVPEVWRYRARKSALWFGRRVGDHYEEMTESLALPGLTSATVLGLLAETKTRNVTTWLRWLEDVWFPQHRDELIARGAGGKP